MTTLASPHVGDVGTLISIQLLDSGNPVDLSAATELSLIFRKPSGECLSATASFATDGSDGIVQIITTEDFLDQVGIWKVQAHVVLDTWDGRSDATLFNVAPNICRVEQQS